MRDAGKATDRHRKRWTTRARRGVIVVATLAVALAACGDDDDTSADTSSTETSVTASSSSSSSSTDTSDPGSTSSSGTAGTSTTLPGEPYDGFAAEGDVLVVMGVAHNDVLNIRAAPGTDQEIVATAAPTADDLVATGEARMLPNSIWYEVTADGITGWASTAFLAFLGSTDDVTSAFLDGGPLPETETMVEMGELVAAGFAIDDPPSKVVQTVAPSVGDLGEVTYDVVGQADDAVGGLRLHVFATPSESSEGFVLKSIEATTFCTRGVSDGACV
ncbi:MAG: SH3 domain-containing protein [Acidimicrobiia bacterium]|nr:SH3 domain-containing protein [Acidimicrobiia bacterium]